MALNFYAVVPAAGESSRMGRPKLLLPWRSKFAPACQVVVDAVARNLVEVGVQTTMICRKSDTDLIRHCHSLGTSIVEVTGTLDMRASIQGGVRALQQSQDPPGEDAWCFFMPADLPTIRKELFEALMEAAEQLDRRQRATEQSSAGSTDQFNCEAITPWFNGKSKHPALLKWSVVSQILELPEDKGLNSLLQTLSPRKLMIPPEWVAKDIDTFAEYQQMLAASQ